MAAAGKTAPTACPRCGEEKEWRMLSYARGPGSGNAGEIATAAFAGLFGAFGLLPGAFGPAVKSSIREDVIRHRGKRGFSKTYMEDRSLYL